MATVCDNSTSIAIWLCIIIVEGCSAPDIPCGDGVLTGSGGGLALAFPLSMAGLLCVNCMLGPAIGVWLPDISAQDSPHVSCVPLPSLTVGAFAPSHSGRQFSP